LLDDRPSITIQYIFQHHVVNDETTEEVMRTTDNRPKASDTSTGADIILFVEILAARGRKASEIMQTLRQNATFQDRPDFPSDRKVQRLVREFRPKDPSGPWRFNDSDTDRSSIRFLLNVVAAVVEQTDAAIRGITNAEATWLEDIHAAAPEALPWFAFSLAREYLRRQVTGESAEDLDLLLAFSPWRPTAGETTTQSWTRYQGAVDANQVTMAPFYILQPWIAHSICGLTGGKGNVLDESTWEWSLGSSAKGSELLGEIIEIYDIRSRYLPHPKQVE